ncbi:MAG: alkaline phosphatase D family protein, partial [Chloroflexi bacterium]|nr:alkaline phosphatase D family protein [Chloroflexota bacterium]
MTYYRHIYRGYFGETGFRSLLENFPTYMMWDDHDIIDNWGSKLNTNALERSAFKAASHVYREYQHLHNPGSSVTDAPPYSYSFWHGNVGFLVLDVRSMRDYEAGRVIGNDQWQQTEQFLASAAEREASTIFVVATIPLVHHSPAVIRLMDTIPGSEGANARDRWNSSRFNADRFRLLNLL